MRLEAGWLSLMCLDMRLINKIKCFFSWHKWKWQEVSSFDVLKRECEAQICQNCRCHGQIRFTIVNGEDNERTLMDAFN